MIPTLRRMFCLFAFTLGAGGALWAGMPSLTQARPVVRVAIFPHEPGTFLDAQGRPTGLFVEALQEVAEQEGWDLQFRMVPWAETLELARRGEVDLVTTVARNPEREAFLDFGTEPAHTMWTLLYVAKGSALEDVTSLRDRTVALLRGDRNGQQFAAFCQRIALPCTFQEHGTFDEVLAAVAEGRADAGVTSSLYGYWHEGRFAVHRTPVVLNPFPVHFAGPKGRSQAYLAALDRFLGAARGNEGAPFRRIRDRWMHPQETRALPLWIQRGIPLLLGLLALATGGVILFQRQVRRATARIRDLNAALSSELQARKRSESRLETLARLNADFLFTCHHEGAAFRQREWITDAFYRITGYTEADLEQHGCWLFVVHPEDRPAVEAAFAALPPGARDTRTFRLLTRDGRVRWVRCHTEVAFEGGEGGSRRLGSVEDITGQVEAERRLSENRQELQAVYDQAPVMLCVLNTDRRIIFANQAFILFTGQSEEAVLAHRIGSVLRCPFTKALGECGASAQCQACALLQAIEHTLGTGEPTANTPYRLAAPGSGNPLHLLASTRRLDHPGGDRLLLSLLDVSELRNAERALLEAKAQYQTIVEASPTAILVLQNGRYTYANAAAADMLGYENPAEILGLPMADLLQEEDVDRFLERMARTPEGLSNPALALRFRRSDGSLVDTETRSAPIHLAEGPASLVLSEDVTGRKRVETLRKSRMDLAEFAMGHSLKDLLRHTLDLLEDLTGSRIGIFRFLDEAPQAPVDQAGVWVDALNQGRTVIRNEAPGLASREGLPGGRTPEVRELATPIQRGGRVVGILEMGGKPTPYTPADLELVEQLAHAAWDIIEGKRKEEALLASEHRNRALLEANPDLMFVFSADGRILDYKAEEASTLFVSPEHFLHRPLQEVLPGPLAELTLAHIQACLATRTLQQYEYALGDGPRRWFESRMVPHGPEACLAIVREVTGARRDKESLQASEERFRLAMEATSDGLWDWDLSAGTLYFSPRAFTMLGYPPEAHTSPEAIFDLIHPEERADLMADLDAWLASPSEFWVREFRLRRIDGTYTWVFSRGRKVAWDETGKPLRAIGTHVDLSDQKATEAALLEREQRLQQLASVTEEGLIVHDRGVIIDLNPAALRMHGAAVEEALIGHSVLEFVAPEDHPFVQIKSEDEEARCYDVKGLRVDGSRFPMRVHARPMEWYGRKVRVASIQDLSTVQHLEDELAHQAHRFELLFRYLPGALFQWRVRPDGRDAFDMLSPQARAIFGLEPGQERPSRELARHIHPDDRERFLKGIEQATSTRREWNFDGRILEPDGRIRWFHGQSFPVPDGEDLVFHGLLLDTTDRMESLEALVDREAKLQAVFSQAAVGLMLGDGEGRIDQVNNTYLNLLGYDRATFLKLSPRDFTPPEDLAREAPLAQELAQGLRDSYNLEKRNIRSDGREVWVHVHVSRVFEARTQRTRYLGVILDVDARKRAESALAESETRFRTLFETHSAPFLLVEPESGRFVDVNASACAYYGYTREEFLRLGTPDINVLPEVEAKRIRHQIAQGQKGRFTLQHRLKNGEIRTVSVLASPVEVGGQTLNFAVVYDITEQTRAEQALAESEARFRNLFNNHNAPFLLLDPENGEIVDANPAAQRYYGYPLEALKALNIQEINALPAEDMALERQKAARREQNYFIFPHRLSSGEIRTVEVYATPVRIGDRTLLFSIVHDISERVEVEEALRRSERRFRLLMDASSDAVFLYGFQEDGQTAPFAEVSSAACSLLGYTREELMGLSPRDLILTGDPQELPTLDQVLQHPSPRIQEVQYRARDGRSIPLEISRRLIQVDQRPMVLAIARDITERKRAQALDTATEGILAKGRMAAYIAHEINNPLAGIKSAFRLVAEAVPTEHPRRRYVDLINQEITRIGNIVKTMYELYKPASTAPADILVETVLQDAAALLAPKARAHRASILVELPDPLLRATVQSDLLRQILFNLIQNALEVSPPQGQVECSAQERDGRLHVQVRDEGPGIAEEIAPRIFEPGFSTKHAMGGQMGLGLGLGSARKLAEGMGGTLFFANNTDGKGCTFTLDLPRIQHGTN